MPGLVGDLRALAAAAGMGSKNAVKGAVNAITAISWLDMRGTIARRWREGGQRTAWFRFGLLLVVILAWSFPSWGLEGGPLQPETNVNLYGVSLLFFFSGCECSITQLRESFRNLRAHLTIYIFSFVCVPAITYAFVNILRDTDIEQELLDGSSSRRRPRPTAPPAHTPLRYRLGARRSSRASCAPRDPLASPHARCSVSPPVF